MVSPSWDAAIAEEDGITHAVWPFSTEKKIGLTIIRNPLLTPYQGPYFLFKEEKDISSYNKVDRIFKACLSQVPKWDFFEVQCFPGFNSFLPFHNKGFEHSQRITYLSDLDQTEEELFKKIKSSQRSHIRQAERELSVVDGFPHLDLFYRLNEHTHEKKGKKYVYPEALFKQIISTSLEKNSGIFLAAQRPDGGVAALLFAVYDKHRMYLLLSATNPEAVHGGAVAMLIWNAIKQAKALGLAYFDFEGSMDPGIEMFFRSFGAERTTYLSCRSNRSKIWKLKKAIFG